MKKSEKPVEEAPRIAFSVWFAVREKRIPAQHMKEIVWADFKGQGLSSKETVATYDKALAKYGIKL